MNLPIAEARAVRAGRSRCIWIPVRYNDGRRRRCPLKVGEEYDINGGGAVVVERVRLVQLGEVGYSSINKAGFREKQAWREAWIRTRDRAWVRRLETPERIRAGGWLSPKEILDRWDRWAETWVWEAEVRRVTGSRLLHKDSSRGYTSNPRNAMRGEPEAITEDEHARMARREGEQRQEELSRRKTRARRHNERQGLQGRIEAIMRERHQLRRRDWQHISWLVEPDSSARSDERVRSGVSSSLMVGTRSGSCVEGTRLENALSRIDEGRRRKLITAVRAAEEKLIGMMQA